MSRQETLTELLLNDSFCAWVSSGRQENNQYWERWAGTHPDGAAVLDEAAALLRALQQTQQALPAARKERLRHRIAAVAQSDQTTSTPRRQKKRWVRVGWGTAAALVLLTAGLVVYQWTGNQSSEKQYTTTYGEIKTIVLPDSSKVTLNGNSTMRYTHQSDQLTGPREVWLSGEAFFEVSRQIVPTTDGHSQAIKFVVHTDQLSVQVLGTRFNVRNRRDQTQVVLEEGKVQLALEEAQERAWLMAPDELVEVTTGERKINPHVVRAADYTAWKEGFIDFDGASLSEISRVLEDNYDLRMQFANKESADSINLTGSFPANRINMLLEAVANVTRTTIHQEGKIISYQ